MGNPLEWPLLALLLLLVTPSAADFLIHNNSSMEIPNIFVYPERQIYLSSVLGKGCFDTLETRIPSANKNSEGLRDLVAPVGRLFVPSGITSASSGPAKHRDIRIDLAGIEKIIVNDGSITITPSRSISLGTRSQEISDESPVFTVKESDGSQILTWTSANDHNAEQLSNIIFPPDTNNPLVHNWFTNQNEYLMTEQRFAAVGKHRIIEMQNKMNGGTLTVECVDTVYFQKITSYLSSQSTGTMCYARMDAHDNCVCMMTFKVRRKPGLQERDYRQKIFVVDTNYLWNEIGEEGWDAARKKGDVLVHRYNWADLEKWPKGKYVMSEAELSSAITLDLMELLGVNVVPYRMVNRVGRTDWLQKIMEGAEIIEMKNSRKCGVSLECGDTIYFQTRTIFLKPGATEEVFFAQMNADYTAMCKVTFLLEKGGVEVGKIFAVDARADMEVQRYRWHELGEESWVVGERKGERVERYKWADVRKSQSQYFPEGMATAGELDLLDKCFGVDVEAIRHKYNIFPMITFPQMSTTSKHRSRSVSIYKQNNPQIILPTSYLQGAPILQMTRFPSYYQITPSSSPQSAYNSHILAFQTTRRQKNILILKLQLLEKQQSRNLFVTHQSKLKDVKAGLWKTLRRYDNFEASLLDQIG